MESYIPRHLLWTSEIRSQTTADDKETQIKFLKPNLRFLKICTELEANYQGSLRRYYALKENRLWTGVGRPLFYDPKIIDDINKNIAMSYKDEDYTHYARIRDIVDADYRDNYDQMEPETREKFPKNLRKKYISELSRQLKINPNKPIIEEKDRYKC